MEIHLNGFQDGNPDIEQPAADDQRYTTEFPAELDVLIIGSGPAGLTLAAQLAEFPEITTRIVERKDGPMTRGQADGVSCRSMEMFNAFGFADRVMKEGHWVNETCFWSPGLQNPGHIERAGRVQDVGDDLSEMPHIILNQARVHDLYLEVMRNSASRLRVDYQYQVTDLESDTSGAEYPVTVTLEHQGQTKTVRSKYVVGCDGARSQIRTSIGRELKGDYAYQSWGVMDVLMITDFPDIRHKNIVKSAHEGNLLVIPREGGYLVRLYVELDKLKQRGESKNVGLDNIIDAASRIFRPYRIDIKDVAWWSVYEIGHSLTDKFDDVPEAAMADRLPHVFIAGDACHTHSAKAGQGMNVSMGDTFNLGWKLISVLTGKSPPELLHTYSAERQAVAQDLIDFDHKWSRIMSTPPEDNNDVIPLIQKHFVAGGSFTAGLRVTYQPSVITGPAAWQHLAAGETIGSRFHSAPVIRLSDARPMQLGHTIKIDTRWHIYAFAGAGDPVATHSGIRLLCDFLANDDSSPILKYTPEDTDIDSVISIYGIFQQNHQALDYEAMPVILKPLHGRFQLRDYGKMFCPDLKNDRDIYAMRGIDREQGCMIVVRPDQYVAHVLPLDGYTELAAFFQGFMKVNS